MSKAIDLLYETIVNTSFLCATGLFNILECFIMNLILSIGTFAVLIAHLSDSKVSICYFLFVIIVFNLIDIKQHSTKEIDNFNNLMRIDDKCNRISEFVDRLLPRHVN